MAEYSRPQTKKCTLLIVDLGMMKVEATYNPKEVSIDKSVPWNKHKTSKGDNPILEFTDAEPKTLSVEFFFDTFEEKESVYKKYISKLELATLIMQGKSEDKKRPPTCILDWGGMPKFVGVVESLSVKYTMFFPDGTPARATAAIKMKQATRVTKANDKSVGYDNADGSPANQENAPEGVSSTAGSNGKSPRPSHNPVDDLE